jgi:hypothetical protein
MAKIKLTKEEKQVLKQEMKIWKGKFAMPFPLIIPAFVLWITKHNKIKKQITNRLLAMRK